MRSPFKYVQYIGANHDRCNASGRAMCSNFVFTSKRELGRWLREDWPKILKAYPYTTLCEVEALPEFELGDKCNVHGEASDVFKIEGIVMYSKDRYGFLLDSGCTEEIAKCHKRYLKG